MALELKFRSRSRGRAMSRISASTFIARATSFPKTTLRTRHVECLSIRRIRSQFESKRSEPQRRGPLQVTCFGVWSLTANRSDYREGGCVAPVLGEAAGGQGLRGADVAPDVRGCAAPLPWVLPGVGGVCFELEPLASGEEPGVPLAAPGVVPGSVPHGEPVGEVPGVAEVFGFMVEG